MKLHPILGKLAFQNRPCRAAIGGSAAPHPLAVHLHGHTLLPRGLLPPPNPVVGIRGVVPGDWGLVVRQDFHNKIRWSNDPNVILVAPRQMAASWMPELLEQARFPPISNDSNPLLTQEVWTPSGHVETRHYQPSNLHAWLLWRVCLSSSATAGT